ncbi:restriction endonuclease subunit S, partial [Escherichia coli]|nr:restriction endonuclease subunit S [Escherichia coli]
GNITYQGGWDFTDLKYLDLSVKEKDKFLVKEGDLLFNRTNSKELVGKTAVYEENRPMAFAGYLIRVRPNPIGNNYYISGYLNSIHGKITLMNMCKSIVGMANINAQELQNIEILIPPKHLQDEYEIIYKKIKKGLSIYDKSAMQLQL